MLTRPNGVGSPQTRFRIELPFQP